MQREGKCLMFVAKHFKDNLNSPQLIDALVPKQVSSSDISLNI